VSFRLRVWGCRGSIPTPGEATVRFGGNTPCVEVRTGDGCLLILDAGTGLRQLGAHLEEDGPLHLLVTHLHLDHVEGLRFFAPFWHAGRELHIWGPPSPVASLDERIATYFSPPLFPVHLSEVPARVTFHDAPRDPWTIGSITITADPILHPGATVGYRLESDGKALAYVTDHEPALGTDLDAASTSWISGYALAHHADLLIHDCQYTEDEYPDHVGWGHPSVAHVASYARRAEVDRLVLFHHHPGHADAELEAMRTAVLAGWQVEPQRCIVAAEGTEIDV